MIAAYVGRIMDWYKAKTGKEYLPEEDPGVIAVTRIYKYYKAYGLGTKVMQHLSETSMKLSNSLGTSHGGWCDVGMCDVDVQM